MTHWRYYFIAITLCCRATLGAKRRAVLVALLRVKRIWRVVAVLQKVFVYSDTTQAVQQSGVFFLMGSMGTIAQTHRSDLDIWICCAPHLEREQKKLLQEKCEKISRWATTLQLEVHFFLMDCDMFREGSISDLDEESSGSAQRYLLLDEFYRTGIYIAGRYPMWWFIPAGQEREYEKIASDLLSRRYIESKVVLDFGPLPEIPRNEFIGAAIWQLYKAIESPYKSILKLFLLENLCSQFLGRASFVSRT